MKKLVQILYTEPVVMLSIVVGVTAVLAQQNLIAAWIPVVVLAVVTPLQRFLAEPKESVKRLGSIPRR